MSLEDLDGIIASVRKLGDVDAIAKTAAPLVEAAVKRTAAAGTSPDGTPWPPRKDGKPALANAAAAVEAVAIGPVVQVRLVGTSTGSQTAQAIQNHTRRILPDPSNLGGPVLAAFDTALEQHVARSMR